jgi:hypothetical protein
MVLLLLHSPTLLMCSELQVQAEVALSLLCVLSAKCCKLHVLHAGVCQHVLPVWTRSCVG